MSHCECESKLTCHCHILTSTSTDKLSDYELVPIKSFHPCLEERDRFYLVLSTSQ